MRPREENLIIPPNDLSWLIASDRKETEQCQRGTVGCPVDHPNYGPETECTTW